MGEEWNFMSPSPIQAGILNGLTFIQKKKKPTKQFILEINLTKEVKDLCNENFKTIKIEIRHQKMKDLPCTWICRINIPKVATLPEQCMDSTQSPSKFQ